MLVLVKIWERYGIRHPFTASCGLLLASGYHTLFDKYHWSFFDPGVSQSHQTFVKLEKIGGLTDIYIGRDIRCPLLRPGETRTNCFARQNHTTRPLQDQPGD